MKPEVKIERLTQLIRVLEEVKADKKPFDMLTWFSRLSPVLEQFLVGNKKHPCGTVSCAAGWAAQDPWFKRRGFTLVGDGFFEGDTTVEMRGDGEAFDACETFFDERNLFDPCNYLSRKITPSMVIAKVKRLIKYVESGVGAS